MQQVCISLTPEPVVKLATTERTVAQRSCPGFIISIFLKYIHHYIYIWIAKLKLF